MMFVISPNKCLKWVLNNHCSIICHFEIIKLLNFSGAAGNFLCPASNLSFNAFRTVMEIDAHGTYNVSKVVYDKFMKVRSNLFMYFSWINAMCVKLTFYSFVFMPPFEKGGAYCFAHVGRYVGRSVGMSVSLNLVQLKTQECFAPEASNLVGR